MARKASAVPAVAAPAPAPLTETESADLAHLEGIVEQGRATFMAVGTALGEISQRQLYRATHPTFEAYCRERWGMGANYARKQIRAAETVAALGPGTESGTRVPILPATEKAARPLTEVKKPADKRKAWHKAVRNAQKAGRSEPTAGDVQEAVGGLRVTGGKIDKLASMRASREREFEAHADSRRVQHLKAALAELQAAAKADDDRWAAKIGAQADRVATLLGHIQTVDRRG